MIIGISGKMGSGKDTIAQMIQGIIFQKRYGQSNKKLLELIDKDYESLSVESGWQIKRFADKVKDITCLLIGCTREQLEYREFKEKPLGEEWNKWKVSINEHNESGHECFSEEGTALTRYNKLSKLYSSARIEKIEMTPRLLMQLIGTEAGREIIHPNLWVNALFANYKAKTIVRDGQKYRGLEYPKWIIPDTRFPNEAKAIRDRKGLLIRVNRPLNLVYPDHYFQHEMSPVMGRYDFRDFLKEEKNIDPYHPSETSLDDWDDWNYVIDNNGTLEELLEIVKTIIKKENIL